MGLSTQPSAEVQSTACEIRGWRGGIVKIGPIEIRWIGFEAEWKKLVRSGQWIEAIKLVKTRSRGKLGLREAKAVIDKYRAETHA